MQPDSFRKVRVLVNPTSGTGWSFDTIRQAFDRYWESPGREICYLFSQGITDSISKARRAAAENTDLLMVVGGDGTFNSVGAALLDSPMSMGIIPTGSGNGLARHFEIPLAPDEAVRALANAEVKSIDVGLANSQPFFVTCSMAWDAAIAKAFAESPVRGILPYVFAGVFQFFEYRPQPVSVHLDSGELIELPDPMILTIANLTQYGAGAVIAPSARPDDGRLELVAVRRQDIPFLIANLPNLLKGNLERIPQVLFRKFGRLEIARPRPAPIQVDGELVEAAATVTINVRPQALRVLVPRAP